MTSLFQKTLTSLSEVNEYVTDVMTYGSNFILNFKWTEVKTMSAIDWEDDRR